jgi:CubicO group peptidase (beta-lactamase class C family)
MRSRDRPATPMQAVNDMRVDRSVRSLAVGVTVVLLSVAAPVIGTSTPARVDGRVTEAIDRHVAAGIEANAVPGASVAVVRGDGTVHLRGFGTAGSDGRQVAASTPFLIGSATKTFTALAIMQLVEDGAVGLDDPVREHLDWFRVEPGAWTDRVTIRSLMAHTSVVSPLAGGDAVTWMDDLPLEPTARQLAGARLTSEPGTRWQYATGNYVLLGAVIETASGRSYAAFVTERILEPLGMDDTYTDLASARAAGLAEGHRFWFGLPVTHTAFRQGLLPAGMMISSADDLGRYLQMLLNGGELDGERIISEEGLAELTRTDTEAHLGPWAKRPEAGYALGWFVSDGAFGDEVAIFHPGATPDAGAMIAVIPSHDAAVAVLVNAAPRGTLPGTGGAIDRIGAGAVSLLMGAEPAAGPSLADYYRVVNVVVGLTLLALATAIFHAARRKRPRGRGARAGTGAIIAVAVVLVAVPPVVGLGWRQTMLWMPDHGVALAAIILALLALAALRVRTTGSRVGEAPRREPERPTRDREEAAQPAPGGR